MLVGLHSARVCAGCGTVVFAFSGRDGVCGSLFGARCLGFEVRSRDIGVQLLLADGSKCDHLLVTRVGCVVACSCYWWIEVRSLSVS